MPWSNVSLVLNSRDLTAGQYNAAQFNAVGQNIIQGQIDSVSLNEINFPYDIPNIQAGYNTFELVANPYDGGLGVMALPIPEFITVTIAPGFYSGTELATAINAAIAVQQSLAGGSAANAPSVTYNATSNLFTFLAPSAKPPANPTPSWFISSPYTLPLEYQGTTNKLGKDILSIMGFLTSQNDSNNVSSNPAFIPPSPSFTSGGSAPLTFTQYIDVCSPQLCKYQEFSGGSTTNLARRGDVICRLYISNNIAVQEAEGMRPFIINRQYMNSRIMRWTTGNSVGTIDINLYDDVGQPLATSWVPRNYQITFNVYESGDSDEKVVDKETGESMTLKRYAAYVPENAQAWNSPSFPMRRR